MIFYFTGTGNTKWVAKQISEAIGEELFYIPDLIRKGQYQFELKQNETIGFCFPTHGWQPPRIVRDFIKKLIINYLNNKQENLKNVMIPVQIVKMLVLAKFVKINIILNLKTINLIKLQFVSMEI